LHGAGAVAERGAGDLTRPPGAGHGTVSGDSVVVSSPPVVRPSLSWVRRWPIVRADAPCVRVDGSWRGDSSRASTRKIRGGGGSARLPRPGVLHGRPSQAITTACGDDGRREPARSRVLESECRDSWIVATWASVVRVVALHGPVQVWLGAPEHAFSIGRHS